MKTALLVIDYINRIIRDGSCQAWAKTHPIVENTNKLISAARANNIPIYFIRLAFDKDYSNCPKHSKMFNTIKHNKLFQLGSDDVEFVAGLDFQTEKDCVINKTAASPFTGNDLEQRLRQAKIEHLIFTGVATDNAINTGVRYAHDQGFFITIVEDTCGASSEALHQPILHALDKIANEIVDTETCLKTLLQ